MLEDLSKITSSCQNCWASHIWTIGVRHNWNVGCGYHQLDCRSTIFGSMDCCSVHAPTSCLLCTFCHLPSLLPGSNHPSPTFALPKLQVEVNVINTLCDIVGSLFTLSKRSCRVCNPKATWEANVHLRGFSLCLHSQSWFWHCTTPSTLGVAPDDEATGEQSLVSWVSWDDSFLCSLCFPIASLKDNSLYQRFVGVDMVSSH